MDKFTTILRELEEYFDAFIVIGSMYNPSDGSTATTVVKHGNSYAVMGMLEEACEEDHYATGAYEESDDE